ncbi:hypothetical protein, partial [Bordetella avium]
IQLQLGGAAHNAGRIEASRALVIKTPATLDNAGELRGQRLQARSGRAAKQRRNANGCGRSEALEPDHAAQ